MTANANVNSWDGVLGGVTVTPLVFGSALISNLMYSVNPTNPIYFSCGQSAVGPGEIYYTDLSTSTSLLDPNQYHLDNTFVPSQISVDAFNWTSIGSSGSTWTKLNIPCTSTFDPVQIPTSSDARRLIIARPASLSSLIASLGAPRAFLNPFLSSFQFDMKTSYPSCLILSVNSKISWSFVTTAPTTFTANSVLLTPQGSQTASVALSNGTITTYPLVCFTTDLAVTVSVAIIQPPLLVGLRERFTTPCVTIKVCCALSCGSLKPVCRPTPR